MNSFELARYGWNDETAQAWQQMQLEGTIPARVVADFGHLLKVITPKEYTVTVAGNLKQTRADERPKVGDWVAIRPEDEITGVAQAVFARKTAITRKLPGTRSEKQILAANVDVAFIVQALNGNFNLGRLDRYMYQLEAAGVKPVFVFNKVDIADDLTQKIALLEAWGRQYIITDALTGHGIESIRHLLADSAQTAVFLGSSGVGKSTLTNQLLQEKRQKTAPTREDDRGRHTTSHRELFLVPTGGIIIDTPGIRELQLWGEKGSLESVFPDIIELAGNCRFRNCQHHSRESGCAMQKALLKGELSRKRFESYLKMKYELEEGVSK